MSTGGVYMLLSKHTLRDRTLLSKMWTRVSTLPCAIMASIIKPVQNKAKNLLVLFIVNPDFLFMTPIRHESLTHQQVNSVSNISEHKNSTLDAVKLVLLERVNHHK